MGAEGAAEQADVTIELTDGPMQGWRAWPAGSDPYETHLGLFCFREEPDRIRCGFLPSRTHVNGGGKLHGGALMSFADFSLFLIARRELAGAHAVTVTFNSEFISAGEPDILLEASGDVLRSTRTMVFVRGLITQSGRAVLAFSGTLKKIGASVKHRSQGEG